MVKISNDYGITVPSAIRTELYLRTSDRLLAKARDGALVLVPRQEDVVELLRGLHREVCWHGVDVQTYVDHERDSWEPS